jgi:DUF1680 family protein
MIGHREGPETCNTYNMLRLTRLFRGTEGRYADFYGVPLQSYSGLHNQASGYVYLPRSPARYRVYSQPERAFWCCVGTGMENPEDTASSSMPGRATGCM